MVKSLHRILCYDRRLNKPPEPKEKTSIKISHCWVEPVQQLYYLRVYSLDICGTPSREIIKSLQKINGARDPQDRNPENNWKILQGENSVTNWNGKSQGAKDVTNRKTTLQENNPVRLYASVVTDISMVVLPETFGKCREQRAGKSDQGKTAQFDRRWKTAHCAEQSTKAWLSRVIEVNDHRVEMNFSVCDAKNVLKPIMDFGVGNHVKALETVKFKAWNKELDSAWYKG